MFAADSLKRYQQLVDADPDNVKPTLLTNMFRAKEEDKLEFDELKNNANLYIVAGSDTTAITLTYIVVMVCRHSAVREKLVAELSQLPEEFQNEDLRKLSYLNQVIEEALRLYGPVPSALPRKVPAEGAELAGYFLPGGTTVNSSPFSLHRDEAIYPRPYEFDPSRWENPTKDMKDGFLAFGAGSRGKLEDPTRKVNADQETLVL
jgi:cytochrome P450